MHLPPKKNCYVYIPRTTVVIFNRSRLKLQRPPCGVQPAPCLSTKIKDTAVPPPAESPPTSNGAEPSGQFMSKSVSANLFGSCGSHC